MSAIHAELDARAGNDAAAAWQVLLVDDEPNILSALRRALHGRGFRIRTASGGQQALELLEQQPADAIVSDMRMPQMSGAVLLSQVRERWPDTVRILLTGYADVASTIEAVNQGEIFRYLTKPWDDARLIDALNDGLERKRLRLERDHLEQLTRRQNAELEQLNRELEDKVRSRTAELQAAMDKVDQAHGTLRTSFLNTMRALSSVIDARTRSDGFGRRVAAHVRTCAAAVGLDDAELQDTMFAAMLVEIGKLALPDALFDHTLPRLDAKQQRTVLLHPAQGASFLWSIENLKNASLILQSLNEWYDGSGVPDGLAGSGIPLGARVLAVAHDYEAFVSGTFDGRHWTAQEAYLWIQRGCNRRYDSKIADAFFASRDAAPAPQRRTILVDSTQLLEGMVLARDLVSAGGVMMLAQEHVLDHVLLQKIRRFEERQGTPLQITVYA